MNFFVLYLFCVDSERCMLSCDRIAVGLHSDSTSSSTFHIHKYFGLLHVLPVIIYYKCNETAK